MKVCSETLLSLTQQLLRCPSVTPEHAGSLDIIADFCAAMGGHCRRIDRNDTGNLFVHFGNKSTQLLFCGHVDVVAPGDLNDWKYPPFSATIDGDYLYGRGAVDMKSSIAAFLKALYDLYEQRAQLTSLALLITSDEEGCAVDGTQYALDVLKKEGYSFVYSLVGEPTSCTTLGDTIKIGRRGSLSATICVEGKQGHVAYSELARNPIHATNDILQALLAYPWSCDVPNFPATQCVCMHIDAHNTLLNVIPQRCSFSINFRYSPFYTAEKIQDLVAQILSQSAYTTDVLWRHSAKPFYSPPGVFTDMCLTAIASSGIDNTAISTNGGTSDARFIRHYVKEVVELGPKNATAHQNNECINLNDLENLCSIYQAIIANFT